MRILQIYPKSDIHNGRIAQMGSHDELMARGDGVYRRLASLQSLDALPAR